jgi:ABC-2 type transport system ATP-binding protein
MLAWNFRDLGNGLEWEGDVPGPDRLRFMGMTSRYVALISDYSLREVMPLAEPGAVSPADGAGGTAN